VTAKKEGAAALGSFDVLSTTYNTGQFPTLPYLLLLFSDKLASDATSDQPDLRNPFFFFYFSGLPW
jgi:hypothetical protein